MLALGNLILILGVCAGVVGAAGFTEPPQAGAYGVFGLGLGLCVFGGLLVRRETRPSTAHPGHAAAAVGDLQQRLESLASRVAELEGDMEQLDRHAFCERIDDLLLGEYFELGLRAEEFALRLGFGPYSRVWNGVAVAERLLARAWSMATDGHAEEARVEIPRARAELARAVREAEAL